MFVFRNTKMQKKKPILLKEEKTDIGQIRNCAVLKLTRDNICLGWDVLFKIYSFFQLRKIWCPRPSRLGNLTVLNADYKSTVISYNRPLAGGRACEDLTATHFIR